MLARRLLLVVCLLAAAGVVRAANDPAPAPADDQRQSRSGGGPFAGRPLEEALRILRGRGLKIIFSTELVRADMRVPTEPHAAPPRDTLDALLTPHHLVAREGPRGLLLIVPAPTPSLPRRTQALPARAVAPPAPAPAPPAPAPTPEPPPIAFTEEIAVAEQTVGAEPGRQELSRRELEELRSSIAGDTLRAVQALPGVAATDDFSSGFSVRGAEPRRIGMSIDGISTPWLVQIIGRQDRGGSVALLNSDIVDRLSLSPGLFSPEYGDRTAGWLDATIREGDRSRRHMRGIASGTGVDFLSEGPLHGRRGSFLAGLRFSQMGWPLQAFTAQEPVDFGFADVQSKLVYDITPRHQAHASVVVGHSYFNERQPTPAGDGWHHALLATWGVQSSLSPSFVVSQRGAVISQGVTATGRLASSTPDAIERVDIARQWFTELSHRVDATWAMRPSVMLETGYSGQWKTLQTFRQWPAGLGNLNTLPPLPLPTQSEAEQVRAAAGALVSGYAQLTWQGQGGITLAPSLRVTHARIVGETALLPAIQASWAVSRAVTLNASTGLQWQAPEIDQVFGPRAGVDLRGERARHAEVGFEARLRPRLRAVVTVYDRRDRGLLRLEDSEYRRVGGVLVPPSLTPRYANALDGGSRGVELTLRRDGGSRVTGWVSYAYGKTRYTDRLTQESFWGDFDQRHTANLYAHVRVTDRTSLAAKFRYGSNVPLTGYYTSPDGRASYAPAGAMAASGDASSNIVNTVFLTEQMFNSGMRNALLILPPELSDRPEFSRIDIGERRNEVRLPYYARLDLRVNQRFTLRGRKFTVFVEGLNLLNRRNVRARPGDAWSGAVLGATEPLISTVATGGILFEF